MEKCSENVSWPLQNNICYIIACMQYYYTYQCSAEGASNSAALTGGDSMVTFRNRGFANQ